MEHLQESSARFIVKHQITEENRLKLEKAVRKVGFQYSGRRMFTALFGLGILTLVIALLLTGTMRYAVASISAICLFGCAACVFILMRSWLQAKKEIHRQFAGDKELADAVWEYRFFDSCYEAIGKHEWSQVRYSHIVRMMDCSGLYVLVEKGNVVRYFDRNAITKGDADALADFLRGKCRAPLERIRV